MNGRNVSFGTYHETGSLSAGTHQSHISRFRTSAAAKAHARELSRRTDGWVTVRKNGVEIASYLNGSRASS